MNVKDAANDNIVTRIMAEHYEYTSLPDGAIRLLELDYDEDPDAPLKGTLHTVSLAGATNVTSRETIHSTETKIEDGLSLSLIHISEPTRPY